MLKNLSKLTRGGKYLLILSLLLAPFFFINCDESSNSNTENKTIEAVSSLFTNKSVIAPGDKCSTGGVQIDMGFDSNKNNILDQEEITKTEYVCNVADGTDASSHPFVVYSSPSADELITNNNIVIYVVFNTEMNPASILASNAFKVIDANGSNIPGVVSYSGIVATFTPSQSLRNSKYIIILSPSITNANGIALGYTYINYFKIRVIPSDYISTNIGTLKVVPGGLFKSGIYRCGSITSSASIVSSFRMSETEITRAQFLAIMGNDPSDVTYSSGTSDPVQNVNWYHAIAFCNKLSIAEGLTPAYKVSGVNFTTLTYAAIPTDSNTTWDTVTCDWSADGYRLPTDTEWMWAAMGADMDNPGVVNDTGYQKYFAGPFALDYEIIGDFYEVIGDYVWHRNNSSNKTHPVGTKLPNELGLYDMSGNVCEWCWDWAASYWPSGVSKDYRGGASGVSRSLRGSSFNYSDLDFEVGRRNNMCPFVAIYDHGFRVVHHGANGADAGDTSSHPFVVYSSPAAYERNITRDAVINIVFNTEMNPASIMASNAFTVKDENDVVVPGTVSYKGIVGTFTPERLLAGNKTYTINLSPAITNMNEEVLGGNYKTYFTTNTVIAVPRIPIVTTSVVAVYTTYASCGGNVTEDYSSSVTSRGVCWSISENPTTSDSKTTDGIGTGSFEIGLIELTPGTLYYVRAYATNSAGTAYGNTMMVTTQLLTIQQPSDYTSTNIGTLKGVPGGTFLRGSTPTNIRIVSSFRMSEKEITRAQFLAIMGTDPSDVTYSSGTSDPVQNVNWYHAIAFCNKLSIAEGLTPAYTVSGVDFATLTYATIPTTDNSTWNAATCNWLANGYRLPTEMEWMWAAMGADTDYPGGVNVTGHHKLFAGPFAVGYEVIGDYAWNILNSSCKTHPVGTKLPNELGLYDMSGNVCEWCWDWYSNSDLTGANTDYRGAASGTDRVLRGGYFNADFLDYDMVAMTKYNDPCSQNNTFGFRVVRP